MSIIDTLKSKLNRIKSQRRAMEVNRAKRSVLRFMDIMGELAQDEEMRAAISNLAVKSVELTHREEDECKKDAIEFATVSQSEHHAEMELMIEEIKINDPQKDIDSYL